MSLVLSRRARALVVASALAASGLSLIAAPASAAADPRPVTTAASWLSAQLTGGLIHNPNFGGFDDYGLSIDTGLALDEVGGNASTVTAIDTALKANIGSYISGDAFGDTGSSYAGATAKAAVFADTVGSDPASYGGKNLLTLLEARVSTTAPTVGRIEDLSTFGDNANVIGQAFAADALDAAGSTQAAPARAFLLKQQCNAGYFRLFLTPDKAAADQTCEGGRAAGDSAPDPDATSNAVRLLLPQIDSSAAAARAIGRAEAWLLAQQHADGSFNGGTSTNVANVNSTGLAGWALGLLGDDEAATKAAVWVRMHQVDETGTCTSAAPTGAVAYDGTALATGIASGITDATADQWRRATSQSLPVLDWAPATTPALSLSAPTYFLKAGYKGTFTATGIVPGDKVCLTGLGVPLRGVADASGKALISPVMPAGTANRTVTVTDRSAATDTAVAKILGAKTLGVKVSKATVKRGGSVTVTVSGLAAGERAGIKLRGHSVTSGTATSAGTFTRTVKLGQKLGKAAVGGFGQFPLLRSGQTSVKVTR